MAKIYKNKYVAGLFIIILVMLNYFQWGIETGLKINTTKVSGQNSDKDFIDFDELKLAKIHEPEKLKIRRDMFYPHIVKKLKPKIVKAKPVIKPKVPPPLTPEQIARKNAKQRLEKVKLMGIMEENGLRKAFIMYEESSYIVSQGEQFAELFKLSSIKPTKIDIMETETTLSRTIDMAK